MNDKNDIWMNYLKIIPIAIVIVYAGQVFIYIGFVKA